MKKRALINWECPDCGNIQLIFQHPDEETEVCCDECEYCDVVPWGYHITDEETRYISN